MPLLLLVLNQSVHWNTLSGKRMCHQILKVMENSPAPSNKLSLIVVAKGVWGIKGQWAFPIWCLNQSWACCKRIRFCNAWFCWCCTGRMHDGSVLPHASWRRMCAGQGPYKEWQRHWFVLPEQFLRTLQMTWSGVSCSWIMHMQLMNTNRKADGIPNWLPRQD